MENIRYVFSATGAETMISAFKSIGDAAQQAGARVGKAFGSMPRATARAASQTSAGTRTAAQRAAAAWSSAGRPMSATEKLAQRVARDQERSAKRVAATQMREQTKVQRAYESWQRKYERDRKRFYDNEDKRSAKAKRDALNRSSARMRGAVSAIGGAVITGAGAIGAVAAGVGGLAIRESLALDDRSKRLAIKGGNQIDSNTLRRGFENTAVSVRGAKATDVAAGVEAFVGKTGDIKFATKLQKTIAEFSVATGTDAEKLGSAMADLFQKFDIKTVDEMADAMSVLTVQGKQGSFELEDAASQFPKLAAAAQRLGIGKGAGALATLGGLTQIARTATGSPEQAASGLEATFRQLTAKSGELKTKHGVSVFDKEGRSRDVRDVLVDMISKVGGTDIEKKKVGLQGILGEEGIRAVSPLISTFSEAAIGTKGTEAEKTAAGIAAMRRQIEAATQTSGAYAEVQRDLASAQQQSGMQMTATWESFKAQVGEQVTPAFAQLLSSIGGFVQSGGMAPFITTMLAITEAGQLVVNMFRKLAGDEDKPKPPAQRIVEAEEAMIAARTTRESLFAKVRGGGELSPEELNQLNRLNQTVETKSAEREAAKKEQELLGKAESEVIGRDEFIKRYAAGEGDSILGMLPGGAEMRASGIADKIIQDPTAALPMGMSMSEQQAQIVQALRDTVTQMRTTTDPQTKDALTAQIDGKAVGSQIGSAASAAIKAALAATSLPR